MRKNIKAVFLLIMILILGMSLNVYATEESTEINWTYEENGDGTVTLTGYSGEYPTGDVVIPAELNGMTVTSIGYSAFWYCESLSSVEIPSSVTSIGYNAFYGCSSLTGVEIPSSVTSIGSNVFYNCPELKTAGPIGSGSNIEFGWTEEIPNSAFYGCSSLTSVEIPESITSIGGSAFYGCSSLTSVEIPESITSIGGSAFSGCSSLTSVEIPESVTSIGGSAFSGCSSLTSVVIPESVTKMGQDEYGYVGRGVFANCPKLKTAGPIGSGSNIEFGWTEEIPMCAFYRCDDIISVEIPTGVTSIEGSAFYECSSLAEVKIPESVNRIEYSAFSGCENLTSIVLPSGLDRIEENTFAGCSSLEEITIPEGVTIIQNSAFSGCLALKTLEIPSKVTAIEGGAFSGCTSLESIELPKYIFEISGHLFYNCSNLKEVIMPEQVGEYGEGWHYMIGIGSNAFANCSSLEEITIPEGAFEIGSQAFQGCRGLKTVNMPKTMEEIQTSAFEGCTELETIELSENITNIGRDVFRDCKNLSIVKFTGNAPKIENYAFYGIKTTAKYPSGNATWTESVRKNYGGTLTWEAYDTGLGGWVCEDGKWYFYEHGKKTVGWREIEGEYYYFNSSGIMVVGWADIDNWRYYMDPSGARATGWRQISGKWYYFNNYGQMVTGWRLIGGKKYYMDESGVRVTGWQKIDGEMYYFNEDGSMKEKEKETEVCKIFIDVKHTAWYEDSIQYVYDEGIIVGDGNVFAPDNGATRTMIAVILYRLAGSPEVTDYTEYNKFKDLPKNHVWYTDAVAWVLKTGVSTGDSYNWLYNPTASVTREQLALFLWRYAKYNNEDVTLNKTEEELFGETVVNKWAKDGFAWAVDRGIIKGAEETDSAGNKYYVLNPQGGATRAQVARMLHRYVGGATN